MGLAILGVVLSGLVMAVYGYRFGSPERYWFLGIAAITPAWLVSLLGFLTGLAAAEKSMRLYLVGASAAALLGVIGTEYCVRHSRSSSAAWHPLIYWALGIASLVPSWGVLLRGIIARA
jgi:hypothetical protein